LDTELNVSSFFIVNTKNTQLDLKTRASNVEWLT
jgi:hypothetical protein